jgi:hypothetical protein
MKYIRPVKRIRIGKDCGSLRERNAVLPDVAARFSRIPREHNLCIYANSRPPRKLGTGEGLMQINEDERSVPTSRGEPLRAIRDQAGIENGLDGKLRSPRERSLHLKQPAFPVCTKRTRRSRSRPSSGRTGRQRAGQPAGGAAPGNGRRTCSPGYAAAVVAEPLKKANRSALIWSALVVGMPCGKPG